MSESLFFGSVSEEIQALVALAGDGVSCDDFQHRRLNSSVAFLGPGSQTLLQFQPPQGMAFIITKIDIKTLYDITDAPFVGADFRSTDDINPYGPLFAGSGGVGIIQAFQNNQQIFAPAFDLGVINTPLLFVVLSQIQFVLKADPQQPVGKNLVLVTGMTGYLVPAFVGTALKKKSTVVNTGVTIPL